ncbi:MAG: hypothetical protein DRJ10_17595 [Bacteroidetes bacterium]|nr:MAG: hypothetical protein DRJ10_17595 [Bacteroidota bacterium]
MKKTIKYITLAILGIITLLGILSYNKLSNSIKLYSLYGDIAENLQKGNITLKLSINGNVKNDTISAYCNYKKDHSFDMFLSALDKEIFISQSEEKTSVLVQPNSLLVTGNGGFSKNFDPSLLLYDILSSHNKLAPWLEAGFSQKLGLAYIAFTNLNFNEKEISGKSLTEISIDGESYSLSISEDEHIFIINDPEKQIHLTINISPDQIISSKKVNHASDTLIVNRTDLNRSILAGTRRAVGILIENELKQDVETETKSIVNAKLLNIEGNRVLVAKGTHKEIGEAHGILLKNQINSLVDGVLYVVGWYYTIEEKKWFLSEMSNAYKRLEPFIPQKYQDEMMGLAETSGISLREIRLANVFPAMFHCSGFAVFGDATVDGTLYHGRVLDYMTEIGLQYNAVVFILHPTGSNAFANISYAGFIGSVSGMNDKQVSFGEMGGGGVGDWDGMPMPLLVREGLESSNTLEDALNLFETTARTCEYYYVIADGKINDARALATTPEKFEIVTPGGTHPQLPSPVKDAVLISAGDRYKKLVERVKENYGKIDLEKAIHLMDRPVSMKSNLHNVLFIPKKAEFWVANAGQRTEACKEPYTKYNLTELLKLLEK